MPVTKRILSALILSIAILHFSNLTVSAGQQGGKQALPQSPVATTPQTDPQLDEAGNIIITPAATDNNSFSEFLIRERLNQGSAQIDQSGKIIIKPQFPADCLLYTTLRLSPDLFKIDMDQPTVTTAPKE